MERCGWWSMEKEKASWITDGWDVVACLRGAASQRGGEVLSLGAALCRRGRARRWKGFLRATRALVVWSGYVFQVY